MRLFAFLILPVALLCASGGLGVLTHEVSEVQTQLEQNKTDSLESNSITGTFEQNSANSTNETLQQLSIIAQVEMLDSDVNFTNPQLDEQLLNETISVKEPKTKPKLNCTPVFRDDSNMTAQLVLVNVSTIARYLQLKVAPPLDLGAPSTAAPLPANQSVASAKQPKTSAPGHCTVLVFYLDWCPFSAAAAPHFNALGRLFPQMNVLAIDAYSLYSTTMRYGVVGVPSMYVFHRNKIVAKYNRTDATIDSFVKYLSLITTFEPVGEVNLTELDLGGPLSSQVAYSVNYVFAGSWAFCLLVAFYYFARSDLFRRMKEHVYNMWNEAQFQHEHID